jgi:serine/threonine-protein kinase
MSAEIFISYARADRDRVLPLVERLREAGVSYWLDEGNIQGATLWGKEIVEAIRNSKALVLIATESSFKSNNVAKEVAIASEWEKPILPVYLERIRVPDTLHYQLAGIQHVELFVEQEEAAFNSMLAALHNIGVTISDEIEIKAPAVATHHAPLIPKQSSKNKSPLVVGLATLAVVGLVLAIALKPSAPSDSSPDPGGIAPAEGSAKRIAVVPFRNIGPGQENTFLAEGMHEEIDAMLSMTPNLMVKDGSRFKEQANDAKKIGEALQVDAMVTGSVRQAGGELRVIVKLVDTRTEVNLWTKNFDKKEGDIFAIQREIAQSIAEGLSIKLDAGFETRVAKRQTDNLEAYNLYLKGRLLWNTRTKDNMTAAIEHFKLALTKDPGFALAHVGIADCYSMLAAYGHTPPIIAYPKAKKELQSALKLNNGISEAHSSLGWVYYNYDWDWENGKRSFEEALRINPSNPEANRWYSQLLMASYDPKALQQINAALTLEPASPITKAVHVRILTAFGKLNEAMQAAEKVTELGPTFFFGPYSKIEVLTLQGKYDEALMVAEVATKGFGNHPTYMTAKGMLLGLANKPDEARAIIRSLEQISSERPSSKHYLSMIYYALGDHDKALTLLEESIAEKQFSIFLFSPRLYFTKLTENEHFKKIYSNLNVPIKRKP